MNQKICKSISPPYSFSFPLPSQYNSLLTSHVRSGDPAAALRLFLRLRSLSLPLDSYSFPPILSACSSLCLPSLGPQIHSIISKSVSPLSSPIPFTSLLDFYSKSGRPADALQVFDEMPNRDSVAWNSLISSLVRNNCIDDAILAFSSMVEAGVGFTDFTLCTLLKALALAESKNKGLWLRGGKQIHAWVCVSGCWSAVMATALVDFYARCGRMDDAVGVSDGLMCEKDAAIHNALLGGFVLNKAYRDAFLTLARMEPNVKALSCTLDACADSCSLEYGKQIHCLLVRRRFDHDTVLLNSLLDMYAKCGRVAASRLVFDRIGEKDVVSWTGIIDAYGSHGLGAEALDLFGEMEEESGVSPNTVTFLSLLSACNYSGLVEEGRRCFVSMRGRYGLEPSSEHYACYIDMLGRAGRIEEAWGVFRSLDAVTPGICVVMLNACRVGGDLVRGEVVANRLLKLDPESPGIYVLVSNYYKDVGRWEMADEVRKEVRNRGLCKEVGSSQVAVGH